MLSEKFGLADGRQLLKLGGAIFAYLFRRIDQRKLVSILNEHVPDQQETILNCVRTDGYVLKNCKAYAWAFYKSRHGDEIPDYEAFDLDPDDLPLLQRLNLSHIDLTYPAYSLQDYEALIRGATDNRKINDYIGRFVSKRMTFLIRSYGIERRDLEHECKLGAMRSIYMRYPFFDSLLHLTNTAKTGIHNAGESQVTFYTSPARQRLLKETNGAFISRHLDTETLTELEAPPQYLEHIRDQLEILAKLEHRMKPTTRRFIACCAGQFDEGFSAYLQENNTEAVEQMAYSRYLSKAKRYFALTDKDVAHIFSRLRYYLESGRI
jgi:hypothetical protein